MRVGAENLKFDEKKQKLLAHAAVYPKKHLLMQEVSCKEASFHSKMQLIHRSKRHFTKKAVCNVAESSYPFHNA